MAKKTSKPKGIKPEMLEKVNDQRREITEIIISMMEADPINWARQWTETSRGDLAPISGRTGRAYSGRNAFTLAATMYREGFTDPRWYTIQNVTKHGWTIKEGATERLIEKWSTTSGVMPVIGADGQIKTDDNGNEVWRHYRKPILLDAYLVVNASEIEGIEPWQKDESPEPERTDDEADRFCDRLISACDFTTVREAWTNNTPCFSPLTETVKIPDRRQFTDNMHFMRTLAHELVHATGIRLNRKFGNKFGSQDYAREELVAELGSAYIQADNRFVPADAYTGDNEDLKAYAEAHIAYLQSWIQALRDDPEAVYIAANAADRAAEYIAWHLAGKPSNKAA